MFHRLIKELDREIKELVVDKLNMYNKLPSENLFKKIQGKNTFDIFQKLDKIILLNFKNKRSRIKLQKKKNLKNKIKRIKS